MAWIAVFLLLLPPQVGRVWKDVERAMRTGVPERPAVELREVGRGAGLALATPLLRGLRPQPPLGGRGRDVLLVGDAPAETLQIEGPWVQDGDIVVFNDGVLLLEGAQLEVRGDIYVLDRGVLEAEGSTIAWKQDFIYHRRLVVGGQGRVAWNGGTVRADGYPYTMLLGDSARAVLDSVRFEDWTTGVLLGSPSLEVAGVGLAGEFAVFDSARCVFRDVDTLLVWLSLAEGTVVDMAYPSEVPLESWEFPGDVPGTQGIGYSVALRRIAHPWWGMVPGPGSQVVVRDSHVRTCGLLFAGSHADTLSGLVNGGSFEDTTLPLSDRVLRFVATTVETFSLYPMEASQLLFSNGVLGEVVTSESSFFLGRNFILDGTGGHLEASGSSVNIVAGGFVTADVLARDTGLLILAGCAQQWGRNWAVDASRLFLVQTLTTSPPEAMDAATSGYAFISGPSEAPVGAVVPVSGSVWVDSGPEGTADLVAYQLLYQRVGEEELHPVGGEQVGEVHDGILGLWDTEELAAGDYLLHLRFWDTLGDTLSALRPVHLEEVPAEVPAVGAGGGGLVVRRLGGRLVLEAPATGTGEPILELFDVRGRRVVRLLAARRRGGRCVWSYAPGRSGLLLAVWGEGSRRSVRKILWLE
jgi:hypothetical protein